MKHPSLLVMSILFTILFVNLFVKQEECVDENVNNNNTSQPHQTETNHAPESGQTIQTQEGQTQRQRTQVKRRARESRSDVWNHFTKIFKDGELVKASGNYERPKRNGTSSLKNHMESCKKHLHNIDTC